MKTQNTLVTLRRRAGLAPVAMSAAQLRRSNPELARKWAGLINDNKRAIASGLVNAVRSN